MAPDKGCCHRLCTILANKFPNAKQIPDVMKKWPAHSRDLALTGEILVKDNAKVPCRLTSNADLSGIVWPTVFCYSPAVGLIMFTLGLDQAFHLLMFSLLNEKAAGTFWRYCVFIAAYVVFHLKMSEYWNHHNPPLEWLISFKFGIPVVITSENASNFTSNIVIYLCKLFGIKFKPVI